MTWTDYRDLLGIVAALALAGAAWTQYAKQQWREARDFAQREATRVRRTVTDPLVIADAQDDADAEAASYRRRARSLPIAVTSAVGAVDFLAGFAQLAGGGPAADALRIWPSWVPLLVGLCLASSAGLLAWPMHTAATRIIGWAPTWFAARFGGTVESAPRPADSTATTPTVPEEEVPTLPGSQA